MGYYVKVTKAVAKKVLEGNSPLAMTKDGNCLLWQSELNGVDGATLQDRAEALGGALLPESEAMAEIKGTCKEPLYCYTPSDYDNGESAQQKASTNDTGSNNTSIDVEGGVTPEVKVEQSSNEEEETSNE